MKPFFCKRFSLYAVFFCIPLGLSAQSGETFLAIQNADDYSFVERSNWRRYDNGRYTGLVFREVRASLLQDKTIQQDAGEMRYTGHCIVLEQTVRDMKQSAKAVNAMFPVRFRVSARGDFTMEQKDVPYGFPSLRGFPVFPAQIIAPGATWTDVAERVVDPLNSGNPAVMRINVEYSYLGIETYKDIAVHRIKARYSTQNNALSSTQEGVNVDFKQMRDNHDIDILIRVDSGLPLLIRDILDETYTLKDNSTLRFAGFTLTFTEKLIPMDKNVVVAGITGARQKPPAPLQDPAAELGEDVEVAETPEGVKLTIKDIRFIPDSDAFFPEEKDRLDAIAIALMRTPDRVFMVEGHTADTGQPVLELDLSTRRAMRMIEELVKRGIPADRFLYKGWGGTKPVGDNGTESGRARNRRVEITILE
ncbi:MAG: OmpA family protein [Treponema sp.]|jgi:outer membrane protein OmpA-like peptidoglycan-associated protein|nr:OmpA family protein [Treponema sp.]